MYNRGEEEKILNELWKELIPNAMMGTGFGEFSNLNVPEDAREFVRINLIINEEMRNQELTGEEICLLGRTKNRLDILFLLINGQLQLKL